MLAIGIEEQLLDETGTKNAHWNDMTRMLLACCLFVACPSAAFSQTRPNVTGTWVMDEKRSGSPLHEAFVTPAIWTIQQTADRVVIDRKQGDKVTSFTYTLLAAAPTKRDSSVKAPTVDAPGHRGYWDGDRLILETLETIQGKSVTAREVVTLDAAGELIVERVVEVEHGYTMKGAKNFSAVKDVFIRKTP